jgi:hypothetical protein
MTAATQESKDQHHSTRERARLYRQAGLSIIPILGDGSKAPAVSRWKPYQERFPSDLELDLWFPDETTNGIAIVSGKASGNAELLDFDRDAATIYPAWRWLVEAEAPGLLERLTIIKTPRPGFHVRYRCSEVDIPGNTKLAVDPALPKKDQVFIETRGEGGYALAPGSPACCHDSGRLYEHIDGPALESMETITAAERDILWRAAQSFDRSTPAAEKTATAENGELLPGDDYNQRGPDWSELLEPAGWRMARQLGAACYWCRPNKDRGWSATTGVCRSKRGFELFYVFSSNAAPFELGKAYSKFAVLALLSHNGDFKAAARALAKQGYGKGKSKGKKKTAKGGQTGYEIILKWFQDVYKPDHKRGTSIYTAKGEVKIGVALLGAPIQLIDKLEGAVDAPCLKTGDVNRASLPQFFNTWARSAWMDLLESLDEEEEAAEVNTTAGEQFQQKIADVLQHQESFGHTKKNKYGQDEMKVERRSLISWCNLWKKSAWASVRDLNLWCRYGSTGLEVAFRRELFAQVGFSDLAPLTQSKLTRLCERYDVGQAGYVNRQRVVVLLAAVIQGALVSTLPGDDDPADDAPDDPPRDP